MPSRCNSDTGLSCASALQRLPEHRFNAVLRVERRVTHDGFVAVGGNFYSVPDRTRRIVEVEQLPDLIRVIDRSIVVAEHPVLEGRRQYRIDRRHRTGRPQPRPQERRTTMIGRLGDHVPLRSLAVYEAIGAGLAMHVLSDCRRQAVEGEGRP